MHPTTRAAPRVLVVGKLDAIVHLTEGVLAGLLAAGCDARAFAVNGADRKRRTYLKALSVLGPRWPRRALADAFAAELARFRPQLIFFVFPYYYPPRELYPVAEALEPRPVLAGWVGDRFRPEHAEVARRLDRVYYTDSGLLTEAARWGFPDNGRFLPLAVDPDRFRPSALERRATLVFVANVTAHRAAVVAAIRRPIVIWGRHWDRHREHLRASAHEVHARRLPAHRLPLTYATHRAVLNVRNEANVLDGMNQRSFEPAACRTAVVNDAQPDLELCFEPDREILVYRDDAELNALHQRIAEDAALAAQVGDAAFRRVLAEHTYRHRMETVLRDVGLDAG